MIEPSLIGIWIQTQIRALFPAIFLVRFLNLFGFQQLSMNPDAVSAGERFPRRESLRVYSGPADGQQAVVAGHPGWRKIGIIRINKYSRATHLPRLLEFFREIGPGKFCDDKILRSTSSRDSDNRFAA